MRVLFDYIRFIIILKFNIMDYLFLYLFIIAIICIVIASLKNIDNFLIF